MGDAKKKKKRTTSVRQSQNDNPAKMPPLPPVALGQARLIQKEVDAAAPPPRPTAVAVTTQGGMLLMVRVTTRAGPSAGKRGRIVLGRKQRLRDAKRWAWATAATACLATARVLRPAAMILNGVQQPSGRIALGPKAKRVDA